MTTFKFLKGKLNDLYPDYITPRWIGVEIDGYEFMIHTHLSIPSIQNEIAYIYGGYIRMWDDDRNRARLLELLQLRFPNAVNEYVRYEDI